jgi:DNA helicase-2/ATP-dependent DNA helicase PcrA
MPPCSCDLTVDTTLTVSFEQLTPEQQGVADAEAATCLVLGGAGVGKTTTALWAARRELTDRGNSSRPIPYRRVLFVTFSRTAVGQIRSRAGGVLAGIADSVEILTFHGLAYRLVCAFGRYVGQGGVPTIVGEARTKLGRATDLGTGALAYDDLLPIAIQMLETPGPISTLLQSRWSLVICDEFQDTDDQEWRLLQLLGDQSRLLFLADPNQMIYGFKTGVSDRRLDVARDRSECTEVTLPAGSHRDPTQVIPDAAAEIRWRRFESEPVLRAVRDGKLVVYTEVPDNDSERARIIAGLLTAERAAGYSSFGIYAKTNNDAAGLSAALTENGVDHAPIGFGEAYGESLSAMLTMMEFAHGERAWEDVGESLGIALTASVRSTQAPPLAVSLSNGAGLPLELERRLAALRSDLNEADGDVTRLAELAAGAWERLLISNGRRAWSRAGRSLIALAARQSSESSDVVERLALSVLQLRNESFVELDSGDTGAVQLMNFHQTKGREADVVILSHTSSDWYGYSGEPYEDPSRVLYVSITRARHKVIVLLPSSPHALVAQFAQLSDGAS